MCIPEQNMESHQQENGSIVVCSKIPQSDVDSWGKADSKNIIVNHLIEEKKIEWNDSIQLVFMSIASTEISVDHTFEGYIREIKKRTCNVGLKSG